MEDKSIIFLKRATYLLLFSILFFYVVIEAKQILMPLSLGFIFATLMFPVAQFLEKKARFPKTLAILISVLLFVALIAFIITLVIDQFQNLISDFPAIKRKALDNLEYVRSFIERNFSVESEEQMEWMKDRINSLFESGSQFLSNTLNATAGTVINVLLIPVFMFYMLAFREQFQQFIIKVIRKDQRGRADRIMSQINLMIQKYISGIFTVVLILAVLNSIGLYIVGLKYAIVFGIVSALFNLIPYFGTWIGAVFPITFALLTGDSPSLAISVLIFYAIIQFTENNILTPNITGGYVRLNPLITIISIIAGGMVWGVTGMLVVVPFIATIKILAENIEILQPYAFLIGNKRSKKVRVNIEKVKRFFKRWLK